MGRVVWEHDRDLGRSGKAANDHEPGSYESLAGSVAEHGVEQPVVVQEFYEPGDPEPWYRTRSGKRRCEANRDGGHATIDARILPVGWEGSVEALALRENRMRRGLSPAEEIRAIRVFVEKGWSGAQLANEVGYSEQFARNLLRAAERLTDADLAVVGVGMRDFIDSVSLRDPEHRLRWLRELAASKGAAGGPKPPERKPGSAGVAAELRGRIESAARKLGTGRPELASALRQVRAKHRSRAALEALAELAELAAGPEGAS